MDELNELTELVIKQLGWSGRMLSGSKSGYSQQYPDNVPVFNANIIARVKSDSVMFAGAEYVKIWYGDVDLTIDEKSLDDLAAESGCEIYLLREMDGRFENEDKPNIDRFVYKTTGKPGEIGPGAFEGTTRNDDGVITLKQ